MEESGFQSLWVVKDIQHNRGMIQKSYGGNGRGRLLEQCLSVHIEAIDPRIVVWGGEKCGVNF